ncbi:MAG: hypothetical protein ACTS73_03160 [Arsenophonus sp. NEOnobi-MAG3]
MIRERWSPWFLECNGKDIPGYAVATLFCVHKTSNVLGSLQRHKIESKVYLQEIRLAESRYASNNALDVFLQGFSEVSCNNEEAGKRSRRIAALPLLRFPVRALLAVNKTTNSIEFGFMTVSLPKPRDENKCGSRKTTLLIVFKLHISAQKDGTAYIRGFDMSLVVNNLKFEDG